ncbi:hypothetical protein GCM10007874_17200 [Labrys miyagiensis]|uniref:DUF748 domain-containing protein n=1 Tax=Labrys miyagiensis TaxID=346912 RepID=A0ABQ6CEL5_9HYPH|nr:hypothetical protein [Labrys miyagiensis]GLS18703.1 hypothetical protein GCM10007874_17200 [Labrys miyagiensis]
MASLPRHAGSHRPRLDLRRRIAPSLLALVLAGTVSGGAFAQASSPPPPPRIIIGTSSDDGSGTSVFGNVELSSPGGASVHITRLTLTNFKHENGRFQADDAKLEGVEIRLGEAGPGTLEIPSASLHALSGALPDKAALSTSASPGSLPPIAGLLLAAKAERIEIPQMQIGAGDRSATYADIVLINLDSGRLASLAAGKVMAVHKGSQISLGSLRLGGADFNPYADWLDNSRAAKAAPGLKTVYDSFELNDIGLNEPDGSSRLKKVTIAGLKLAPPNLKPSELADTLEKMGADNTYADRHPADVVRLVRTVLPAFSLDSVTLEGLDIHSTKDRPVSAALVRIEAISGSAIGEIRFGDIAGVSNDDNQPFTLGSLSLRGFSVGNLDKFLDAIAAGTPPKAVDIEDYPQVRAASFAMSDFSGESPKQGPIRVEGFTLDAPQWTGLLPSQLSLHLKGLSGKTGTLDDADGRATLEKFGIDTMVINADANLAWAEADKTLAFGPTSAEIEKVAKVSLNGTIGNVPKSLFLNPASSYPELLSADMRGLSIGLEERGGIRKLLDISAKENNADVEQLPKALAGLASARLTGLIGAVNAEKIAAALQTFLSDPGRLQIDMTTSTPIALAPLVIGGADQLLDQIRNNVTVDAKAD